MSLWERPKDKVSRLYRDRIKAEMRRPEIREEKREFIKTYFSKEPFFAFRPLVFVPAFATVLIVVLLPLLQQFWVVSEDGAVSRGGIEVQVRKTVPASVLPAEERYTQAPRVEVKRVSSETGPVMVYQKNSQGVPVTVVWVFPGGKE